ncbi:MAG TPA: hypothetical protein VJ255_12860, partial [Candidatus Acidoferrum sp.]|nr:hypothetical protein [Candidatus Acidoferrum sp.]
LHSARVVAKANATVIILMPRPPFDFLESPDLLARDALHHGGSTTLGAPWAIVSASGIEAIETTKKTTTFGRLRPPSDYSIKRMAAPSPP